MHLAFDVSLCSPWILRVDVPSALSAMMSPWRLHSLTLPTPLPWWSLTTIDHILLGFNLSISIAGMRYAARISEYGSVVAPPDTPHQRIKPQRLIPRKGTWLDAVKQILRTIGKEEYQEAD
jgi:hypothetical protein